MWSSQKHKNIDAQGSGTARTGACILAFFKVVASSQISPHFETVFRFRLQRYTKNLICKAGVIAFVGSIISNVSKNRPKISKMYYLRSINITPINLKRYATNI